MAKVELKYSTFPLSKTGQTLPQNHGLIKNNLSQLCYNAATTARSTGSNQLSGAFRTVVIHETAWLNTTRGVHSQVLKSRSLDLRVLQDPWPFHWRTLASDVHRASLQCTCGKFAITVHRMLHSTKITDTKWSSIGAGIKGIVSADAVPWFQVPGIQFRCSPGDRSITGTGHRQSQDNESVHWETTANTYYL